MTTSASSTSRAKVISATNADSTATRCGGSKNCHGEERCITHDLWEELSKQIAEFLAGISLYDLVERRSIEQAQQQQEQRLVKMPI